MPVHLDEKKERTEEGRKKEGREVRKKGMKEHSRRLHQTGTTQRSSAQTLELIHQQILCAEKSWDWEAGH